MAQASQTTAGGEKSPTDTTQMNMDFGSLLLPILTGIAQRQNSRQSLGHMAMLGIQPEVQPPLAPLGVAQLANVITPALQQQGQNPEQGQGQSAFEGVQNFISRLSGNPNEASKTDKSAASGMLNAVLKIASLFK